MNEKRYLILICFVLCLLLINPVASGDYTVTTESATSYWLDGLGLSIGCNSGGYNSASCNDILDNITSFTYSGGGGCLAFDDDVYLDDYDNVKFADAHLILSCSGTAKTNTMSLSLTDIVLNSGRAKLESATVPSTLFIEHDGNRFEGTPPAQYAIYPLNKLSVSDKDYPVLSRGWDGSEFMAQGIYNSNGATHEGEYTSPPPPTYTYSIIVNPSESTPNTDVTVTLSGSLGNETYLSYQSEDEEGHVSWLIDATNNNYELAFLKSGSDWMQYNIITQDYDKNLGANYLNPAHFTIPQLGLYEIKGTIYDLGSGVTEATDDLLISDSLNGSISTNYTTTMITIIDASTGGYVNNIPVAIKVIPLNLWINNTVYNGIFEFSTPSQAGLNLYAFGNSIGYQNAQRLNVLATKTGELEMNYELSVFPQTSYFGSNVSFYVTVYDANSLIRQSGALVKLTKVSDNSYKTSITDINGIAVIELEPSTSYIMYSSKNGYTPQTRSVITTASTSASADVYLIPITTQIPTYTPIPTVSGYAGGGVGQAGGNISPTTCKINLPSNSTLLDSMLNNIACAGIKSGQNQGYVLALIIMAILALFGGKYGKGIGVLIGVIGGYVISLGMGLIPLWTFIAILILAGMLFGYKIIKEN